eukprot:scaffold315325_cov26-Tisochrysis_lutea.AAC.3
MNAPESERLSESRITECSLKATAIRKPSSSTSCCSCSMRAATGTRATKEAFRARSWPTREVCCSAAWAVRYTHAARQVPMARVAARRPDSPMAFATL